jgi:hypothetical protein
MSTTNPKALSNNLIRTKCEKNNTIKEKFDISMILSTSIIKVLRAIHAPPSANTYSNVQVCSKKLSLINFILLILLLLK